MTAAAQLRVLRHRDRAPGPWANGGGLTYEVLRSPAHVENFDWRLSVAEVAAEGPFSSYPGVDRILLLLSGTMRLTIDGDAHDVPLFTPQHFRGEAAVTSALPSGPTMDLNVMTRRGRATADVAVVRETDLLIAPTPGADVAVVLLEGSRTAEGLDEPLVAWDCAVVGAPLTLRGDGALAVITIRPGADNL